MPPKAGPAAGAALNPGQKRKQPPQSSNSPRPGQNNPHGQKRNKMTNARAILSQTSDSALIDGALDLSKFLKAREFEVKALEDGMRRSKHALTTRAFQQVPRDMRRRTASHNSKKVPKRLRVRAKREMVTDNTPLVSSKTRTVGGTRGRLRMETAKRLEVLAARKRTKKAEEKSSNGADISMGGVETVAVKAKDPAPKRTMGTLNIPPKPKSKFRKRQIHKTWLPTHMWHAKRARMTEPKNPYWRFAVPLTPTEKSYRPTHRAGGAKGAVCWDMSYMSTIGLEGSEFALEKVLRGLGIVEDSAWGKTGLKWRTGKRSWSGWLNKEVGSSRRTIAPGEVIWCSPLAAPNKVDTETTTKQDGDEPFDEPKKEKIVKRQLIIRIHPAAFLELWNEVLRLSKRQRPIVHVEDLRFELGSIEITGPASTEALLGVLHPCDEVANEHAKLFKSLAGITNASSLPPNALLTFSVLDPRLRYPPQKLSLPDTEDSQVAFGLLETLSSWPVDQTVPSPDFFSRLARHKATRLPSQRSLYKRKAWAPPGAYPALTASDPQIPILLLASRNGTSPKSQGSYSLIAPWKCILPIWYSLMHCPLSTGGNPRLGGLDELRQLRFEHGCPWFPGDYPGTEGGWQWELEERERRKKQWEGKPKGKRVEWQSLDLGAGRKGELGLGWACDFERLMSSSETVQENGAADKMDTVEKTGDHAEEASSELSPIEHMSSKAFLTAISNPAIAIPASTVITVRIRCISRGVPQTCARIYRLPKAPTSSKSIDTSMLNAEPIPVDPTLGVESFTTTPPEVSPQPLPRNLRQQWLALSPVPTKSSRVSKYSNKSKSRPPLARSRAKLQPPGSFVASNEEHTLSPYHPNIAQIILRQSNTVSEIFQKPNLPAWPNKPCEGERENEHPLCPGEEDLIGFVTTGNYNLAEGGGTGVGCLLVERVLGLDREDQDDSEKRRKGGGLKREQRMCIVRNAGESIGRLALWEVV